MKRVESASNVIAGAMAALVGGIGMVAIASWISDRWELLALGKNYVPMAPLTALVFILLAVALALRVRGTDGAIAKWVASVVSWFAFIVCCAELRRWISPISLPWDHWDYGVETGSGVLPIGRMAPLTAAVFVLSVGAFAGTGARLRLNRWLRYGATVAAVIAMLTAGLVVLAYAAGTPLGYGDNDVPMAWLTAAAFLCLNVGILAGTEAGLLLSAWRQGEGHSDEARLRSRTYRTKLLLVLLGVLVMTVAGGLIYLRKQQAAIRQSLQEQLESIASLKVSQITQWQREREGDVQVLAAMPDLAAAIETLARDPVKSIALRIRLAQYLRTFEASYGYRQVVLFDRNLKPVFVSTGEGIDDRSISDDLRNQIRQARGPLMNDLHRTREGRIHLDLLAPLRTREGGEFAGAVQLTVDASAALYPLVSQWPAPSESGETVLARQVGNEVLYLSELRRRPDSALQLRAPLDSATLLSARALRSHEAALLAGTDYLGVPVLGVARRVAGTRWVLVAKVDQREAYAPIREQLYAVFGGMVLVAGVIGMFLRNLWQERQRQLTEQQLFIERTSRAANERLAYLMQHAGEVILLFDENMRVVEANQRVEAVYGWTPEEMIQLTAPELRAAEVAGSTTADFAAARQGAGTEIQTLHRRKDGTVFPVEVTARPVAVDGRPHVLSIIRDISLRKQQDDEIARLSRLYYVISQINKILLRVKTPEELFTEVCNVLVSIGKFQIAWVGAPDPVTGALRGTAVAGDQHGYLHGIRISVDATKPEGRGPGGTSFREGRILVCNDFFNDPSTLPWRERAAKSDIRSSISLPVRAEGVAVSLLTVYSREKNFFAPREVALLEETVENMSFALEVFAQEARRKAVEAEHRKLSLAVEQNPASIVITDLDGKIEYVNPRFTDVTGYTLAEVRGQNPRVLKSGLTAPAVYEDLWRTITRGEHWRGEIVNRKKSGENHIEQVLIAPVKDATGRPTHYIALKEDITERKQVVAALVESEAKFRRLFAMVPLPLGHSDAAGAITFANERFYRTFGYSASEVPTVHAWWERAYPDPAYRAIISEKWAAAIRQARTRDGEIPSVECNVTCKDGTVRTVEIAGMFLGDEMLITFADITERVQADKQRRQMSRIIEQAPIAIAITDLRGAIEYVNPAFLASTGYLEAEVLGRNPRVLKSGLTPPSVYREMWETLGRGEVWRGELSNKRKNGEIFHERCVIAPVADETGQVTHFAALKEDITRSKQTEDELRESNERFRALFDTNLDGLLITVPSGEILAANPAACAMLGRSEAELCRLGRSGTVAPDDPRVTALVEERRRTGKARGIITMVRGDGSRFEAEISSSVFGTGAAQRNGMVMRDITDRIKTEEALRESEARFRELFDLESDAILVYTASTGRIIQANQAAVQLYGIPMDRFLGMTTTEISAEPEASEKTRAVLGEVADQIIHIPLRYHRRSDGSVFPAEINLRSFRRGDQILAVGVIRDISEQMRAQDQMRRFNEELEAKVLVRTEEIAAANNEMQALLQSIPDLVMRVSRGGAVLSFQPAKGATPLAKLTEAEVTDTRCATTTALRSLIHTIGEKTLGENSVVVMEQELPTPAGPVAVEMRAATITPDDFVVFVRDVTARKRFEAEMAAMLEREHQVSAMKTRFISVTSHEFRTPMAAAMGSVELLTNHSDRLVPAKRTELLGRISQSLFRMTEMLDEMLLMNRMDANRVEMRLAPVDLQLFVRNLVEEIRLGDKVGHPIEFECSGATARFVTDTNLLHHILGNIVSNAVRYSPAGAPIAVRLLNAEAGARVTVEDHGIGIPAADLQRIFEPFERGSNVGNIKGTGLGLNIVKRMVEMLQGEITVQSSPAGSIFTVTLPPQTPTPLPS